MHNSDSESDPHNKKTAFDTPQKYARHTPNSRLRGDSSTDVDDDQYCYTPTKYVTTRRHRYSRTERYVRRKRSSNSGNFPSRSRQSTMPMLNADSLRPFDDRESVESTQSTPRNSGNDEDVEESARKDISEANNVSNSSNSECERNRERESSETNSLTEEKSDSQSEDESTSRDGNSLSSDDDSRDDEDVGMFDELIYTGSTLSIGASCFLTLQFCRKYKLPKKAQNDLINLIRLHIPEEAVDKYPENIRKLVSRVIPLQQQVHKKSICQNCKTPVALNSAICSNGHEQEPLKKGDPYFYNVPLEPQMKMLLEDYARAVIANQEHNYQSAEVLKDITDGALYKKLFLHLRRNCPAGDTYHVTLMLNTDGAPVFKSQNYSIWPLYASVLELAIDKRLTLKNVLLLGLWYGRIKPDINAFLKNVLAEIDTIRNQGGLVCKIGQNIELKFLVHLHSIICDLPAKSMVLHHKLYNGKFGCVTCLHPGKKLPVRGNVRVYPYKADGYQLRTVQEMKNHAHLAEQSGTDVYGVKGLSILHSYMWIPDGCPVDYMHCILQGTAKWILKSLVDSTNKDEPYYLKPEKQRSINERLTAIFVPHDMDRKPRTLTDIKQWKASEIQHFLLYFGLPLLKPYLPPDFFHHFALLSTAMWLLLKKEVTLQEINCADRLINSFCRLMKLCYGERSETINVHNLTHLPNQVKEMGPLWTHSAFGFEAMIAHTLKGFKGTRGVPQQIIDNYLIDKEIHPLSKRLEETSLAPKVKDFSRHLAVSKPRSNWMPVTDDILFSVPFTKRLVNSPEADALNILCVELGLSAITSNMVGNYAQRISKLGEVFHSKAYKRSGQSCSRIIQFCNSSNNEHQYGEIHEFVNIASMLVALVKPIPLVMTNICKNGISTSSDETVKEFICTKLLGSHHIAVAHPAVSGLTAVLCKDILAKCIVVEAREAFVYAYITPVIDVNCT